MAHSPLPVTDMPNLNFLQQPFDPKPNRALLDKWMAGQGPAHLFVYYQKPYKITDQGEVEELRQPPEFIVTYGKCPFQTVWRQDSRI